MVSENTVYDILRTWKSDHTQIQLFLNSYQGSIRYWTKVLILFTAEYEVPT